MAVKTGRERTSPLRILLKLRMTEVVVTTGAIRRAKLHWNRHQQQTNTQFFTGQMPFLSPNQQCQRTEGLTSVHVTVLCKLALQIGQVSTGLPNHSGFFCNKRQWRWRWWQMELPRRASSSQITNIHQHSVFYRLYGLDSAKPTVLKHWKKQYVQGTVYAEFLQHNVFRAVWKIKQTLTWNSKNPVLSASLNIIRW